MKNLKQRTIRGGSARICAQAANFLLRVGSLMVLARLLSPQDFGLVGMVTALTGVLNLFRDFGLSAASVQRATVTEEQTSTLFWINVLVGGILTMVALALLLLSPPSIASLNFSGSQVFWQSDSFSMGQASNTRQFFSGKCVLPLWHRSTLSR